MANIFVHWNAEFKQEITWMRSPWVLTEDKTGDSGDHYKPSMA